LLGIICSFLSFLALILTIVEKLIFHATVQGWASLMTAILFLGSVQLLTIGILGEYIGRNFQESKRRPLYVIRKKIGL
ncbi:MAG: glycosyltransferase, partial [Candidatus Dormibacteraceae bacterium]